MKVFVYGTLRPGCGNYNYIAEYPHTMQDATLEDYAMYIPEGRGGFPYALPQKGAVVKGTVIHFTDESTHQKVAAVLNSLAGYKGPHELNHYDLTEVNVHTTDGEKVDVFTYIAGYHMIPLIRQGAVYHAGGDWMDR